MLTGTAEIILGCERNMHVVCKTTDKRHKIVISSSANVNIRVYFHKPMQQINRMNKPFMRFFLMSNFYEDRLTLNKFKCVSPVIHVQYTNYK